MCCASTSSSSPPTRDPSRSSGYSVQSSIRTGRRKVPPAVLTQAKTPLLVYRFFADLNVRVFERTAILSNFVGPIWILPLAILILNPLPCLSEILERRPPCIGGQVTSIGVIDRAVCVSAPTAEYLNEANRHDHKGNYRKCSHLTGMLVVLSAVRKNGGPKRPPLCIAQVLRITLSQRLVQRTPIERLVAALERITGRPFSLGHHALAAEKFIPLAQAFVRFNIYAKRNEIVFSVLVFANEYR